MCFVVPRIFGFEGDEGDDIIYVNWLNMVRAGLLALEFYSPETRAWRQVKIRPLWTLFIMLCLIGCETHLVTAARIANKEGLCFCGKLPKVWVLITCCFNVKNQSDPRHLYWLPECPHHFALQFHVNVSTPFYTAASCQCAHTTAVSCECVHTILYCSFM